MKFIFLLSKTNRFVSDINYTIPISRYKHQNKNKIKNTENYSFSPSIDLEKKKVDGFEIQYKQTF